MGTSHRQAPVRDLVGAGPRRASPSSSALPDGYEVVLGNGGTTAFWDAAAAWLVRERCPAPDLRRVLAEVRQGDGGRTVPRRPDPGRGRARRRARAGRRPGRRRDRLGPQRDLDRRDGPGRGARRRRRRAGPGRRHLGGRRPAARRDPGRRLLLRAAEGLRRRRRPLAGRCSARPRSPGSSSSTAPASRWQPAFLSLQTALDNSRKDQTYNTPALATLLLLADQVEWMLAGRPRLVRRAHPASSGHLYGWAEASEFADALRRRPGQALAGRRHDRLRRLASTPPRSPRRLRANGIVDVEPYRKLGRNQLRIGMFPAVEPADVEALTACIDWVVENVGGGPSMKVLVKEKIADSGVELLRENFDVDLGLEMSDEELREAIGAYDAILIRSATQADAGADRAAPTTSRSSAAPAPASTTSTSRPRPGAASSSPTRPNRTRSPPPSTPWR